MRNIVLLALLLFSAPTVAAMDTPSAVLNSSAFTGSPRIFQAEAHTVEQGTFYSMWVRGMQDGRGEWYKAKIDVTAHMQHSGGLKTIDVRLLVYRNMLYGTVVDSGLWTAIPVEHIDTTDGFSVLGLLAKAQVDFLSMGETWKSTVQNADSHFTVTKEGYATGNAYSLRPMHPNSNTNVHIRMNTAKDGRFGYGKMYVQRGAHVLQGNTQPHDGALYLSIPERTTTQENFNALLMDFTVSPAIKKPKPVRENSRIEEDVSSIPQTISTVEVKRRALRSEYMPDDCDAANDAIDNVGLSRKGFCPTEKLHKRVIHGNDEPGRDDRRVWQERVEADRLVDAYDNIAIDLEYSAKRRRLHDVKALLSRMTIQESGSDIIDAWITDEIIPFFVPAGRGWVGDFVLLEDEFGHEGLALQKTVTTSTGKRKNFVIFLFEEDIGDEPVITDIYFNTRLSDLRAEGLIQ